MPSALNEDPRLLILHNAYDDKLQEALPIDIHSELFVHGPEGTLIKRSISRLR